MRKLLAAVAITALSIPTPVFADHVSDTTWDAVAACESENGRTSSNIYQFSPDTAAKVGIDGSESAATQRAAANAWADRIAGSEGTSAGWPSCWPGDKSIPATDPPTRTFAPPAAPTRGVDLALTG